MAEKVDHLVKDIEGLSLLEVSELVKALEDKFGIIAAATQAMATGAAPAASASAGAPEADEGQTTFNVILANAGANKIGVIKAVRELNQTLGLKETKDLVESAPKEILSGVNKITAEEAKKKLEAAGATVELK